MIENSHNIISVKYAMMKHKRVLLWLEDYIKIKQTGIQAMKKSLTTSIKWFCLASKHRKDRPLSKSRTLSVRPSSLDGVYNMCSGQPSSESLPANYIASYLYIPSSCYVMSFYSSIRCLLCFYGALKENVFWKTEDSLPKNVSSCCEQTISKEKDG